MHALEGLEADRAEARKQWELQLQCAEYEAELAQRRYEAADPANRLVAAELEAQWEEALRRREAVRRERAAFERRREAPLGEADRQRIKELAKDLVRVWQADTTTMADRKALLRFLVKRVHLDGVSEAGKIRIDVEWHTGRIPRRRSTGRWLGRGRRKRPRRRWSASTSCCPARTTRRSRPG